MEIKRQSSKYTMDHEITTWLKYFYLNITKNAKYQNLLDTAKTREEFLFLNTRQETKQGVTYLNHNIRQSGSKPFSSCHLGPRGSLLGTGLLWPAWKAWKNHRHSPLESKQVWLTRWACTKRIIFPCPHHTHSAARQRSRLPLFPRTGTWSPDLEAAEQISFTDHFVGLF